jgi:adenine specific DNA methylase Mod
MLVNERLIYPDVCGEPGSAPPAVASVNKLYFGDNLDVLREHVGTESVDLIYLDPPFNSNASYNVLFREPSGVAAQAQAEAFRDTWEWGDGAANAYEDVMRLNGDIALILSGLRKWLGENAMMAYLVMMAVRLIELQRVLKPSGSLYLHCDPVASHYLKIIMDAVFGHENFRNEVIWRRTSAHNKLSRQFGPIHDVLLFYSKTKDMFFQPGRTPYLRSYIDGQFRYDGKEGRYRLNELTGSGTRTGDSGKPWHGYDPTPRGRHWALPLSLKEMLPKRLQNAFMEEQFDYLAEEDLIVFSQSGRPTYKQYPGKGVLYQDIWAYQPGTAGVLYQDDENGIDQDVKWLDAEEERIGYPTQKPLGLLNRIIDSSSNEGQTVLDPFCGCGTTVEAAQTRGREWVGIDVTHYAITLIERRLTGSGARYDVHGRPTDLAGARDLARRDKHQFQWWAAWRLGSQSYREEKRGPDRGIDGNMFFHNGPYGTGRIIVSVKGGEHIGVQMVRDLRGVIERENAEMGVLVTLAAPTGPMQTEANSAGFVRKSAHDRLPRLQIVTVEDMLANRMPRLPPLPQAPRAMPPARKRTEPDQLELLLPFEGGIIKLPKTDFIDPRFDARIAGR